MDAVYDYNLTDSQDLESRRDDDDGDLKNVATNLLGEILDIIEPEKIK